MARKNTIVRYDVDRLKIEQTDVETISANTDESLLNTRSNSESNTISKGSSSDSCYDRKTRKHGYCCSLVSGIILATLGVLMLIWTPFNVFMDQRLNMIPGLPPFEWWREPPDEVLLSAYIFNVTNAEAFIAGTDKKMQMEEVGPIVYLEKLRHSNVTFNENGTLSYVSSRSAIYLPTFNTIDLNATIVVPNYALIGIASYLHDASFMTKFGFNMILRSMKTNPFMTTTVYNYLWNLTDPILSLAEKFAPTVVPSLNIGILDIIYSNFKDTATVYIGQKYGHEKFFLLDKFDGTEYLPGHGVACGERIVNSTEGVLYPQYITKNITLRYWRKTLCRVIPLYYELERYMDNYNVMAYKFTKPNNAYDRKLDLDKDCHKGEPTLPSGLSDVGKCYNGLPMAASFPHFLYGDETIQKYVTGLKPNISAHESYVLVEPTTGIPIESVARSQSNLIVPDLTGFGANLYRFNKMAIPMFWLEYNQVGLPYYITTLLQFTVNVLPAYQYYFIGLVLAISIALLALTNRAILKNRRNNRHFKNNSEMHFEEQAFIKHT
ncbi:uncharacterized protein CBL_02503 [Carabus blaptoides fortunei]